MPGGIKKSLPPRRAPSKQPKNDIPDLISSSDEEKEDLPALISSDEEREIPLESFSSANNIPELVSSSEGEEIPSKRANVASSKPFTMKSASGSSDEDEKTEMPVTTPYRKIQSQEELPHLISSDEENDEPDSFSNEDSDYLPPLISSSEEEWEPPPSVSYAVDEDKDEEEEDEEMDNEPQEPEEENGMVSASPEDLKKRRRVKAKRRSSPVPQNIGWKKGFLGQSNVRLTPTPPHSPSPPSTASSSSSSGPPSVVPSSSSSFVVGELPTAVLPKGPSLSVPDLISSDEENEQKPFSVSSSADIRRSNESTKREKEKKDEDHEDLPDLLSTSESEVEEDEEENSESSEDEIPFPMNFAKFLHPHLPQMTKNKKSFATPKKETKPQSVEGKPEKVKKEKRKKVPPPEFPRAPVASLVKKEEQEISPPEVVGYCWEPSHTEEDRKVTEEVERVEVKCSANCELICHQSCWKKSLKFQSMDQTAPKCPTPDCWGQVSGIRFLSGGTNAPVCIYSHTFGEKEKGEKEKEDKSKEKKKDKSENKEKKKKKKKTKRKKNKTKEGEEKLSQEFVEESVEESVGRDSSQISATEEVNGFPTEEEEKETKEEKEEKREERKEEEKKEEKSVRELEEERERERERVKAAKEQEILQRLKEEKLTRRQRDEIFRQEKKKLEKEFEKKKVDKLTEEEKLVRIFQESGDWTKKEKVEPSPLPPPPKDSKRLKRLAKKQRKREEQFLLKQKASDLLQFSVADIRETEGPMGDVGDHPLQAWETFPPVQVEPVPPQVESEEEEELDLPPHLAGLKLKVPNTSQQMRPSAPSFQPSHFSEKPLPSTFTPSQPQSHSLNVPTVPTLTSKGPIPRVPKERGDSPTEGTPNVRFLPKTHFGQPKPSPDLSQNSHSVPKEPKPSLPSQTVPPSTSLPQNTSSLPSSSPPSNPFPWLPDNSFSWSSSYPSTTSLPPPPPSSSSHSIEEEDEIPSVLKCPLTGELMREPVIAGDGFTYERTAILDWLRVHKTSPVTKQPLASTNVLPNESLKSQIEEWKANNTHNFDVYSFVERFL